MYKHYIKIDENNNIIEGFSDAFKQPSEGDICINENGGRHFELLGEVNSGLFDTSNTNPVTPVYKYKWNGTAVVEKTNTEKYDTAEYVQGLLTKKLADLDQKTQYLYQTKRFSFKGGSFSISPNAQANWHTLGLISAVGTLEDEVTVPEQNNVDYTMPKADAPSFLATAFYFANAIQSAHNAAKKALIALVGGVDNAADRAALEAWVDERT